MTTKVNIINNAAYVVTILCIMLAISSCGNNNFPNISMTVNLDKSNKDVSFFMIGIGKITIDWGDGMIEAGRLRRAYNDNRLFMYKWKSVYINSYSNSSAHTIKISATALRHLDCSYNQLTKLDLRANTALTSLHCWTNELTSLDVIGKTSLN